MQCHCSPMYHVLPYKMAAHYLFMKYVIVIVAEEVAHMSLLVTLSCHVIALLQSRLYWNKAAPTSFGGRKG